MISIRRALRVRLLTGLLLLLTVGGVGLYLFLRQVLASQFDDALAAKARALAAAAGEQEDEQDREEIAEVVATMPEFGPGPAPEYFELWDASGHVTLRSPSLAERDLRAASPAELRTPVWDLTLPDGRPGRAVVWRIEAEKDEAARPPLADGRPRARIIR